MRKSVSFSPTTAIFYTYTLEEYPGRIPDPPLRLSFNDAVELLQIRSKFRKETEHLEAVRAKLEAEQERDKCEASLSTDSSSPSDFIENEDSATCGGDFESSCNETRRGDVLSRTRRSDFDDGSSMKHKVDFPHASERHASALATPPASPLSPTHDSGQVSKDDPSSQAGPSACAAISLHPSPPPSPVSSTLHSRSPTIRQPSNSSRCEHIDASQQQPPENCCTLNNPPRNHGRIGPGVLSPMPKSLVRQAAVPSPPPSSSTTTNTSAAIHSDGSSCFLQGYQTIAHDSNASHPNDIRPYAACLVQV